MLKALYFGLSLEIKNKIKMNNNGSTSIYNDLLESQDKSTHAD